MGELTHVCPETSDVSRQDLDATGSHTTAWCGFAEMALLGEAHGSWWVEGGVSVAEAGDTGWAVPVPGEAAVWCCMAPGSPQESHG